MSAESDLRALLVESPSVAALAGVRVRANRAEQGDSGPFVVFRREETESRASLDGLVTDERVVFEVQCWADQQAAAEQLADAVSAVLAAADHDVMNRATDYDSVLDKEAVVLTVVWWVD